MLILVSNFIVSCYFVNIVYLLKFHLILSKFLVVNLVRSLIPYYGPHLMFKLFVNASLLSSFDV